MALLVVAGVAAVSVVAWLALSARHPPFVLSAYDYARVTRKDIAETLQLNGLVDFATTLTLRSPAAATVRSIHVTTGAAVSPGQVLMTLASPEAEEELRSDQAELERKRREHERLVIRRELDLMVEERAVAEARAANGRAQEAATTAQLLFDRGSTRKTELQAALDARDTAAREMAEAQRRRDTGERLHLLALADAEQDIRELETAVLRAAEVIEGLTVRSPIRGKVIQILAGAGTALDHRGSVITLVDQDSVVVRFDVSESRVRKIALGQPLTLEVGGLGHAAHVATIDARAVGGSETTTSTVAVTAVFDGTPPDLLPGASARAVIELSSRPSVLTLPRGPFLTTGGGVWVYRIVGDRAVKTAVEMGAESVTDVEVSRGLAEGDTVIVSSYDDLIGYEEVAIDATEGNEK